MLCRFSKKKVQHHHHILETWHSYKQSYFNELYCECVLVVKFIYNHFISKGSGSLSVACGVNSYILTLHFCVMSSMIDDLASDPDPSGWSGFSIEVNGEIFKYKLHSIPEPHCKYILHERIYIGVCILYNSTPITVRLRNIVLFKGKVWANFKIFRCPKDPLVKIQIFVNYLENLWYDAASFIIPHSVVLPLSL